MQMLDAGDDGGTLWVVVARSSGSDVIPSPSPRCGPSVNGDAVRDGIPPCGEF